MILNVTLWIVLLVLTLLAGALALRAWRARNLILKVLGGLVLTVVTLLLAVVVVVSGKGMLDFYSPAGTPPPNLQVQGTPAQIARGQHIAEMFCVGCHTTNGELPLVGGRNMGKEIPMPIGDFISVNLTPAGPLKNWTDGEIMRVLREGVDRNGKRLAIMGAAQTRYLSDEDLHAVIAYLRSQPPVENVTPDPPDAPNMLAILLYGAGMIPQEPPVTGVITAPPKAITVEYGKYIVSFADCRVCHGADLSGGTSNVAPHGPNLRVAQGWTRQQFVQTIRTGIDPGGHQLSDQMPWKDLRKMDDEELGAIHEYLMSLPGVVIAK